MLSTTSIHLHKYKTEVNQTFIYIPLGNIITDQLEISAADDTREEPLGSGKVFLTLHFKKGRILHSTAFKCIFNTLAGQQSQCLSCTSPIDVGHNRVVILSEISYRKSWFSVQ